MESKQYNNLTLYCLGKDRDGLKYWMTTPKVLCYPRFRNITIYNFYANRNPEKVKKLNKKDKSYYGCEYPLLSKIKGGDRELIRSIIKYSRMSKKMNYNFMVRGEILELYQYIISKIEEKLSTPKSLH